MFTNHHYFFETCTDKRVLACAYSIKKDQEEGNLIRAIEMYGETIVSMALFNGQKYKSEPYPLIIEHLDEYVKTYDYENNNFGCIGCKNCTSCFKCENCENCHECDYTSDCSNCYRVTGGYLCKDCVDCNDIRNISEASSVDTYYNWDDEDDTSFGCKRYGFSKRERL